MVPARHARLSGSCLPCRDLRRSPQLRFSSCTRLTSSHPTSCPSLNRSRSAPPPRATHLALSLRRETRAGLVLVAQVSPQ